MAAETFLGWAKRVTKSGEFNLTNMVEIVESWHEARAVQGKARASISGFARCKGREDSQGRVPCRMRHPNTGSTFIFPMFSFDTQRGQHIRATLLSPTCPACGDAMDHRPTDTNSRPAAFICQPCRKAVKSWDDVTGSGKQSDPNTVEPKPADPKLRDLEATIARILHIVTTARRVVEEHGLTLPIGVRTTEHLAKLAAVVGSADDAWRLWVDGRVASHERARFDAAGLPSGSYSTSTTNGNPKWYGVTARILDAGLPVFLVGPAGSGKTYFAKWYAKRANKELEVVVGSGDMAGAQLWVDRTDATSGTTTVQPGPAARACADGSVLLLDEADGFDPNSLLPMNAVLNGDTELSVPVLGKVEINTDVRILAAANTNGRNMDRKTYSGRNRLDGAFLNRFAVVVRCDYDVAVDRKVAEKALLAAMATLGQ